MTAYVSIQRLEQFFDEPEVDSWVSALHERSGASSSFSSSTSTQFNDIGIVDGTFKYSEAATEKNGDGPAQSTSTTSAKATPAPATNEPRVSTAEEETSSAATPTAEGNAEGEGETHEPEFELRDINVKFPTGKLSLVSGPTGSGKSSLFLALLGGESYPHFAIRHRSVIAFFES